MIRYVALFFVAALILLGLSLAWSQDVPPGTKAVRVKNPRPAAKEDSVTVLQEKIDKFGRPTKKMEQKPILRKIPKFKFLGMLKLEGKDRQNVGLIEVDGEAIFRVKEGEKISITLPGKYVALPSPPAGAMETLPPSPGTEPGGKGKGKAPSREGTTGVQVRSPAAPVPEEYQVVFKVVKIHRKGIEIELQPHNERILVR